MSLESKKERFIFLGVVPIMAALVGALATVLFSNSSCQLAPNGDFVSVLSNTNLSGPEKMKALEIYQQVTDRPWYLVRTLVTSLTVFAGILVWAVYDRVRGK